MLESIDKTPIKTANADVSALTVLEDQMHKNFAFRKFVANKFFLQIRHLPLFPIPKAHISLGIKRN